MAGYETLVVTKDDGVAVVALNRPEVRNAINLKMQEELHGLWHAFRYDDDVRCVGLAGEGEHFCTGIDRAEAFRGSEINQHVELCGLALTLAHRLLPPAAEHGDGI